MALKEKSSNYPLSLLQLLIELVKCLAVFLPHLNQLLFVNSGLFIQSLFKMGHLCLTLSPDQGEQRVNCLC